MTWSSHFLKNSFTFAPNQFINEKEKYGFR